jgi:3-hydroxybutyryl-CoA dehydrogenase
MTNTKPSPLYQRIAIIGAGAMGRGIAQIAAQTGAVVLMFDLTPEAAANAKATIENQWTKMAEKGRLGVAEAASLQARLQVADALSDCARCDLVIEAVVERLDIKKSLFKDLEAVVAPTCHLVSNTSSLSVTAIAAALDHPARFAGYHFFNPVPLMKVVEVIGGLRTEEAVCQQLAAFAHQMGHVPVRAADTPGFIVNHAGRGYGTEALRIVSECITDFATTDRILKDHIGFKLGPFELMDLTALDVSHPVMESIYHQYYEEPRYRPSPITAQRLAGGIVGKKVGSGFYDYVDGKMMLPAEAPTPALRGKPSVWVSPKASRRQALIALLHALGAGIESGSQPSDQALIIVAPLGFDVTTMAAVDQLDATRTVGIDMLLDDKLTSRRVLATNPATRADIRELARALLGADGKPVSVIRDSAGFVTQRVVATIVNIGCDICQQGICSPEDLNLAVQIGLGYPRGPLAMGDWIGPVNILEVLFNMQTVYGDPRYRPSPWLRRRAALGLSLMQTET